MISAWEVGKEAGVPQQRKIMVLIQMLLQRERKEKNQRLQKKSIATTEENKVEDSKGTEKSDDATSEPEYETGAMKKMAAKESEIHLKTLLYFAYL